MVEFGGPVLALVVAVAVTLLEVITSSYPRTFYFIRNCMALYVYTLIYGLVGFGVALGFAALVGHGALRLDGLAMSNAWVRAIALGVSVKALLHIRLFSVGMGDKNMPFGTETLVQMFEPWLLERIQFHEFNGIRRFLQPWETQHSDLSEVRSIILANLPYTFTGAERIAFEWALKTRYNTVTECMEMYLRRLGRANFERAFSKGGASIKRAEPTL